MPRQTWITVGTAVVVTAIALGTAWAVFKPEGPPLADASFSLTEITPNADGLTDVTRLTYTLRRPATVSVYFLDTAQRRYDFRRDKPRGTGEASVDFGGVVDGYTTRGELVTGKVLARVLADGTYTWVVQAVDADGVANQITGTLTVTQAEAALPDLTLALGPRVFTPNQDGLDDRVQITIGLTKTLDENGLQVYLTDAEGTLRLPIAESTTSGRKPGEAGVHEYNYDGGIDLGETPPANGDYLVLATAEDRVGQRVELSEPLTIAQGGLPRGEIVLGEVTFSSEFVRLDDTLTFTLTVQNYGSAPLRTTGPEPGYIYSSMTENYNNTGFLQESGAFRVGIMCDTCLNDFPWRWSIGAQSGLTLIPDSQGRPQYYLEPGGVSVVTGGIVLDQIVTSRNPQYFWAGLIQEDVAIYNNKADPWLIEISPR
ncbi:MAG: hypothetical protein JNL73_07460 [Anaerolineales bacterium]|nr:hypothetical protein [Anaerolineales bacterium]